MVAVSSSFVCLATLCSLSVLPSAVLPVDARAVSQPADSSDPSDAPHGKQTLFADADRPSWDTTHSFGHHASRGDAPHPGDLIRPRSANPDVLPRHSHKHPHHDDVVVEGKDAHVHVDRRSRLLRRHRHHHDDEHVVVKGSDAHVHVERSRHHHHHGGEVIVKGNDAHVKVSRGSQKTFHDKRDDALVVASGHTVVVADDSPHRVHVVQRDDFPGVPGTIDIVTVGTSAEQKVGSLVLTDMNQANSTSDPQSFVLDASKTNQTQIYLVANPQSSNSTAPQQGSGIEVMIELPIFVPSDAADVAFCATYDPNPPAPVPFTMQPCLDPTAEGINDATVHKSQTFLYDSQTGAIKPKWFSDSTVNSTSSTQPSSSSTWRPEQADVVSTTYDTSTTDTGASATVSNSASASATSSATSSAPSSSASDDSTLPQNVALVFTPTGPTADSMQPESGSASFAPENYSSSMALSSSASTSSSLTVQSANYPGETGAVSTATATSESAATSVPTETPLAEAEVQSTASDDATSTVWGSDVSPATATASASGDPSDVPVFGIESANDEDEDQSSVTASTGTTSWGSGIYPASATYSVSESASASSSTETVPPLLDNAIQSESASDEDDNDNDNQTTSDSDSDAPATLTTSWASGVYPASASASTSATTGTNDIGPVDDDSADLQPPSASSSADSSPNTSSSPSVSSDFGSQTDAAESQSESVTYTSLGPDASTVSSSQPESGPYGPGSASMSMSMSMESDVYPVSSSAPAPTTTDLPVSPVAEEQIDPSSSSVTDNTYESDSEAASDSGFATSTYWAPEVGPATATASVSASDLTVTSAGPSSMASSSVGPGSEPALEEAEWLFQGQTRRWFGF